MILTKEQVAARLSSPENLTNKIKESKVEVIIKDGINHIGRPKSRNLTNEEKVGIGVSAKLIGNEATAALFGVKEVTASHLRTAQTTLFSPINSEGTQRAGHDIELKNKIESRLESTKLTITERAAEKLLGALGLLTEEKMENCTARDLASVSSQVSQVIRNMNSNGERNNNGAKVQIVLHQPKPSREDHFDMVEIGVK